MAKDVSILPHESIMRQIKYMGFYMGGSGLDQTDDFQIFADQDWIGFNFCGSGLD